MKYAIYDQGSGRISRVISCPEEFVALSCGEHEAALPVSNENDATHYVAGGELVPFPQRPSEYHEWDWNSMCWALDVAGAWRAVRRERDMLIAQTDWTQLPDVPQATRNKYAAYRQTLRDLPQTQTDPLSLVWPELPR